MQLALKTHRESAGMSLPSVVSYAKLQLKVTRLRSHGFKKISPLHVYQEQKIREAFKKQLPMIFQSCIMVFIFHGGARG